MSKGKRTKDNDSGYSRRDFFRTGAAGAMSGGIAVGMLSDSLEASPSSGLIGPEAVTVKLNVDGQNRKVKVEPRVTLLDALRDSLDVTGAKRVCDRATCGACTVMLDGKVIYACSVLAVDAQGSKIETVTSVGSSENMHPIQEAFVDHDASQCGFCTPGFVVACKAVLDEHPKPTTENFKQGLGGNLCRCGTYAGIHGVLEELMEEEVDRG